MPISRNNALYYTKEQRALADANSDALRYAMSRGYDLERRGKYYILREHDSMVFTPDGFWYWNSRGLHGRAPEFMVHYEGKTVVEAILTLAGEYGRQPRPPDPQIPNEPSKIPKPVFRPPKPSSSCQQLYGYLCRTRCLSSWIIREMLSQKILYESDHLTRGGQIVHNACFVSRDTEGKPRSIFQRGLSSCGEPYKREVPGGDKSYGWVLHGRNAGTVYIFEAAIDAASFADIVFRSGGDPLDRADYLALGGLNFTPAENYLRSHPHVKTVKLRLDNDRPGHSAANQFYLRLHRAGYHVDITYPPRGKDWNEYLQCLPLLKQVRAPPEPHSISGQIAAARAEALSRAGPLSTCKSRTMER